MCLAVVGAGGGARRQAHRSVVADGEHLAVIPAKASHPVAGSAPAHPPREAGHRWMLIPAIGHAQPSGYDCTWFTIILSEAYPAGGSRT